MFALAVIFILGQSAIVDQVGAHQEPAKSACQNVVSEKTGKVLYCTAKL